MALDFSKGGYEGLFRNALAKGINLFCGAGFSVEAEDESGRTLPVGAALLTELQELFPAVKNYRNLPRACTKITQTEREAFHSFLSGRFQVKRFHELYKSLLDIRIRNVYTTNIDDLFFRIVESSDKALYLNDTSQQGAAYVDTNVISYSPLHGCVRRPGEYVFGATEIASIFSLRGHDRTWQSLAKDAAENAILFWGWNFADAGPIQAMYGDGNRTEKNTNRWVLLYEPDEETVDYLSSLRFNIIIGDTMDMLRYIADFAAARREAESASDGRAALSGALDAYRIPPNNDRLPQHPLKDFFLEYTPKWSHIYSGNIPKLSYYNKIADAIAKGRNVIVIGIRGSGKTTVMMQLLADYETDLPKHFLVAPSLEEARLYVKLLRGGKSVLFVDDCFRDTRAILELFQERNIRVVCFDRDFNYERQYHTLNGCDFERIEVTEITREDAQSIANIIPVDLRRRSTGATRFAEDPTIVTLLAENMKAMNFRFLETFAQKDWDAARVFLMITYVHACGTPCSFDMVYSFLGDENYTWRQMYDIIDRAGKLISDITDQVWNYNIAESLQNYYQCRSRYFAEKIMDSIQKGSELFAHVLMNFVQNVPVFKICMFDKFKRSSFDADFASRAFPNQADGERYYRICADKDESEYIYQQAALYFQRKQDYRTAFSWIDRARNLSHYNRFSIDSTYAQVYFKANVASDREQAARALDILSDCCTKDKRKSIHFSLFAELCLRFYRLYPGGQALEYIGMASRYIREGLDDKNMSLSDKNKRDLRKREVELRDILDRATADERGIG